MIAKISATENLGGALGYNFHKVESKEATILLANGLYQNSDGIYTMNEVLADMQKSIPANCRTKKTVFHCSLNPHPDEKLSADQLTQIAKEYMEALGYGNQPYIVFKHNDIAREHIHIVSLRVDSDGKKINDKFEKRRSKKITDELERKYGLIPSSDTTEKADRRLAPIDITNGDIKEQVSNVIHLGLRRYAFCSLGELNAILSRYNLAVEEVKTEFRGKRYNGLVYIPTDNNGKKIGTPINASDIGRGVGYSAVQNRMKKSKAMLKEFVPDVRKRVLDVMRSSPQNENELKELLEKQGLRVVIRKNENGRIYGITFVDDEKGIALNGSRLGKGYSANCFNDYFANPQENRFLDERQYGNIEHLENKSEKAENVHIAKDEAQGDNLIDELIEDMTTDVGYSGGNDDWKEAAWQRKLRRQNGMRLKRRK